jgi:hypothetical protein
MLFNKVLYKNAKGLASQAQLAARSLAALPTNIAQALVGQLLGDAFADRSSPTANTRITWSFGTRFEAYASFLGDLFSDYCNNSVYAVGVKATSSGPSYTNFRLKTITCALFNPFFEMFYVLDPLTSKYVKIVPLMIHDLMSPITLAHLIMGDGNYDTGRNRVRIYTNSFTKADCDRLASAITAMGIDTSVLNDKTGKDGRDQFILTIGARQLEALRSLVGPHMHSSMLYRIGI